MLTEVSETALRNKNAFLCGICQKILLRCQQLEKELLEFIFSICPKICVTGKMLELFNGYCLCIYLFLYLGTTMVAEKRSNSSIIQPCAKRIRLTIVPSVTRLTPSMSTPLPVQSCTEVATTAPVQSCTEVATTAPVQSCTEMDTTVHVQSCTEATVQANPTTPVRSCAKPRKTTPDVSVMKIFCMHVSLLYNY